MNAENILQNIPEEEWTKENLEKILMDAAGEQRPAHSPAGSVSGRGDFLWPLRVALTGAQKSPSPFEVAWVLGKNESLKRIKSAIQSIV